MSTKAAMITIVGRPNVGKSTLTNRIVGEKVAIVSNKPQTTRNRICGVITRGETQMVFMDTPGFHKPKTRLGDYMVGVVKESVSHVDAILLMVEPIPNVGAQEAALLDQLKGAPVVLVINKIDELAKEDLLAVIATYSQAFDFTAIVPISARTGDGVEELLKLCDTFAIQSPHLFPEGMTTDQPEKQVMAEIIREKLLWNLDREIPHGTAVEITKFTERDNGIIDMDATIYCEKDSHKGIIIGKQGSMLKKIGSQARTDCEKFMGTQIHLQTWVKVKNSWRDSNFFLQNFGFM